MNTLSVACRRLVMFLVMHLTKVLVIAVLGIVSGIPVPASAASEGQSAVSGQHPLTLDGQPLSRLLDPTLTTWDFVGDAGQAPHAVLLARSQRASSQNRSWVRRHPALFGAIVGAVAGAVIVGGTVHAEASPIGFYGGGASGAVVGWVVSR